MSTGTIDTLSSHAENIQLVHETKTDRLSIIYRRSADDEDVKRNRTL